MLLNRVMKLLTASTMALLLTAIPVLGKQNTETVLLNNVAVRANTSRIMAENGISKLVINNKVINNMFGVYVYCTGIDPTTDRFLEEMKDVIDKTAQLKIPILSFDILWKDYDPSNAVPSNPKEAANRFRTNNLDAVLDYAAENNVFVVLQLLVHAHWGLPDWWKQYKDNANGSQLVDAVSDPSGAFNLNHSPVASFQNSTHRELLKALITRLVRRYRAHPALAGWQINLGPTGENGYGPSYIEVRLNKQLPRIDFRTVMADYSSTAKDQFRLWLKVKYASISVLNASWATEYASFAQVAPPLPMKISSADPLAHHGDRRFIMIDWQQFRHDALLDEWQFLSTMVRELDSDKLLFAKTSWQPAWLQSGTETMLSTAEDVNRLHLIDVDKIDTGILAQDYISGKMLPAYRVDFANFIEFSRRYKVARIINLENWVKSDDPMTRGKTIPSERALSVKDSIRDRGGYVWFVVSLLQDQDKPAWSWAEVRDVVKNSKTNELENIVVKKPSLLFYYDTEELLSYYYEEKGNLRACRIYYQLAKALFDPHKGHLKSGFISSADVAQSRLNSDGQTKILVMANQRVITKQIVQQLKSFIASGGRLLLIGSNGVFDKSLSRDDSAVNRLARLNKKQIQHLYRWEREKDVKIPLISITATETRYVEIPVAGDPAENYRLFKKALGIGIAIPSNGVLSFQSKRKGVPHRQQRNKSPQERCGDGVCDNVESSQLKCPQDCNLQGDQKKSQPGMCGDGVCDGHERRTGMCKKDCLYQ